MVRYALDFINHTGDFMAADSNNLIWIDLEMTGLDTFNDLIIEIATIATDKHLNILAEGPVFAIAAPRDALDNMDEWNTRQHARSGLLERVRQSDVTAAAAEQATLEFVRRYAPKGASPMCGNSICQDRRFLARLMPELEAWFHYRNLDVSSVKEMACRWRPDIARGFEKKNTHLAMDDIRESIGEMVYYRRNFLRVK